MSEKETFCSNLIHKFIHQQRSCTGRALNVYFPNEEILKKQVADDTLPLTDFTIEQMPINYLDERFITLLYSNRSYVAISFHIEGKKYCTSIVDTR